MVEIFLDHLGINPDRKNNRGEAAFLLAARLYLNDIAEVLSDHPNTNSSMFADNGLSLLSLTLAEGISKMAELLEHCGAEALGGNGSYGSAERQRYGILP